MLLDSNIHHIGSQSHSCSTQWHLLTKRMVSIFQVLFSLLSCRKRLSDPTPTHTCTHAHKHTHTHTHTHQHTSILQPSGLCPGMPNWAGTREVKPIWILLKQEAMSVSGISWAMCKFAPCRRQPCQHPPLSFYRPGAVRAAQLTASKHWRQVLCCRCPHIYIL